MKDYEVVIIGGGPAGLAAALAVRKSGIKSVLILERDEELGGILNQCIHNGFGLHTFHEELTGPEYAERFIQEVKKQEIEYRLNTMVLEISPQKEIRAANSKDGYFSIQAEAVILAMGCRERPRGALNIPGYRPAGIFSAGTVQRLINMEGYVPGKEIVILGSGDIGLIMARRLTLEGAHVIAVVELAAYSSGLKRNIVQCLEDFDIPLLLNHTVVEIKGKYRVEGVVIARVDESGEPIEGSETLYPCDTLLLSCGLIPENELSNKLGISLNPDTLGAKVNEKLETCVSGVFACGNVLHVHDLVDYVSQEAARAGKYAAEYVLGGKSGSVKKAEYRIEIIPGAGLRYTVPNYIDNARIETDIIVRFRVKKVYRDCMVKVYYDGRCVMQKKRTFMVPGEMEQLTLPASQENRSSAMKEILIRVEDAEYAG